VLVGIFSARSAIPRAAAVARFSARVLPDRRREVGKSRKIGARVGARGSALHAACKAPGNFGFSSR